jgi:Uma2 family endonuclease
VGLLFDHPTKFVFNRDRNRSPNCAWFRDERAAALLDLFRNKEPENWLVGIVSNHAATLERTKARRAEIFPQADAIRKTFYPVPR